MPTDTRKPRPTDVARWVAVLADPEPRYGSSDWKYWRRDCDKARASLRTWGLGDDGQPCGEAPLSEDEFAYLGVSIGAPTQASADALAASLWTAGEAVGDPWVIAQGVPVGRGAAPLSGPCCEEPAQ